MKTTYPFPILCSLNEENKISNFCILEPNNFENNDLFLKIVNELNLNPSAGYYFWDFQGGPNPAAKDAYQKKETYDLIRLSVTNESVKNIGIATEYLFGEDTVKNQIFSYLINQIETFADPNFYVIIPENAEIIGIPQITGSFDKTTNTFSPAENPNFPQENGWQINPSVIGPFFKPKPDETYLFDFEKNDWFPDPELDYDVHSDGKPYRYNPENKLWYPNWEPEPESDS